MSKSTAAKATALSVLKVSAVAADRVRPKVRGVVVLLYHRVGAGSGLQIDLPVDLFARQMEALNAAGTVVPLDDALDLLEQPTPPEHDPVVVTFDDGTDDFVRYAVPVLEQYNVPATLYVATDFVERRQPFPHEGKPVAWSDLEDACSSGLVTVGSHTHTHALLDRATAEMAAEELDRSIGLIEDRLGASCRHFAYPKAMGTTGATEAEVRKRFRSAAIAGGRPNRYGRTDPHRLLRTPIQVSDAMRWFRHKAAGGMGLEGTLRRALNRGRYIGAAT